MRAVLLGIFTSDGMKNYVEVIQGRSICYSIGDQGQVRDELNLIMFTKQIKDQ